MRTTKNGTLHQYQYGYARKKRNNYSIGSGNGVPELRRRATDVVPSSDYIFEGANGATANYYARVEREL